MKAGLGGKGGLALCLCMIWLGHDSSLFGGKHFLVIQFGRIVLLHNPARDLASRAIGSPLWQPGFKPSISGFLQYCLRGG